jgi:hypothetical protein
MDLGCYSYPSNHVGVVVYLLEQVHTSSPMKVAWRGWIGEI